ncbi:MAG: DUF3160 domain-containing protein, partial [Proteobacteria bacterium]|nr:DUF3160 domain-containing protein [Pseudomonadota bacterium]
ELLARSVGTSTDLYAAWLAAIRGLAVRPAGAVPGFMDTPQFADLRLNSALAAYGQLRHNHVLLAAQNYDQGGCEIPDGYVEPVPATYRALVDYAIRGREVFTALDPRDTSGGAAYFTRLERLMRVLASLASEELANRPLSADAKRFLAMIVEMRVATAHTYFASYPIATFDGWYLDLFSSRTAALHDAAFVADYATFDREGVAGVHYLGAQAPRLGVFVVDTGGGPRVMVGPVAHAFTFTGPQERRLTDDDAAGLAGNEPWAASFAIASAAPPSLTIEYRRVPAQPRNGMKEEADAAARAVPVGVVRLDAPKPQGRVVVELLDHHFVKLGEVAATVGVGRTDLKVPAFKVPIEALRVRVGNFQARVDVSLEGLALRKFGPDAIP